MLLGKRLKKALALFMLISLLPCIALSEDNPGRFSRVLEGNKSPFDAWCFDDTATAKLKATIEFAEQRCNLRLSSLLEQEKAKHKLELGNIRTRLESVQSEYDSMMKIKDQEINQLEEAALKRPNDYSLWWAAGGAATGVLTTILIMVAVR